MDKASPWPAEVERVRGWYQPHLERLHDDAAVRAADLVQLERIADTYPSRERFLTDLTLDPPDATSDEAGPPHLDEDYLILSTIHSAKGQEWNAVFVLNGVDGCIPSDMATGTSDEIEEERRLLYVAMTRAQDQLAILVPQRFYVHQQRRRWRRPPPLRRAHPLHPRCAAPALRHAHLARRRRAAPTPRRGRAAHRHRRPHARHVAVEERTLCSTAAFKGFTEVFWSRQDREAGSVRDSRIALASTPTHHAPSARGPPPPSRGGIGALDQPLVTSQSAILRRKALPRLGKNRGCGRSADVAERRSRAPSLPGTGRGTMRSMVGGVAGQRSTPEGEITFVNVVAHKGEG